MPTNQMMPCELLCELARLREGGKPAAADDNDNAEGEIMIEDILGPGYRKKARPLKNQPKTDPGRASDTSNEEEYLAVLAKLVMHSDLKSYQLTETDVRIIAFLWSRYQAGRCTWDFNDLLKPLEVASPCTDANIQITASLLDRKILHLDRCGSSDYHKNLRVIMEGSYELDSLFINALLGNRLVEEATAAYLAQAILERGSVSSILSLLSRVFDSYPELTSSNLDHSGNWYGYILSPVLYALFQTIAGLTEESVIKQIQTQCQLSDPEVLAMLLIHFHSECVRENFTGTRLINLMATDAEDAQELGKMLSPFASLSSKGILDNSQVGRLWKHDLSLADDMANRLRSENICANSFKDDWKKLLVEDDRFNLVKTRQTIDQLIVQDEIKDIIRLVVEKVKLPDKYDLAQWGLLPDSLTEVTNNGINLLLHGLPGTGKTFAAGAIANSLGRELVMLNAPQLKSHYYGDSQQIVKDCFRKMRKAAACLNPPVFLLNEADQLIHTRLDLRQSCASTENAIQNIILEELETFPGIFIATTNLLENIDEAFFRRFNYKIELPLPDTDCRRQLWKLHLPETIPGAKYIDIGFLAEQYILTGGQIKLIVANACSQAMMKQIKNKHITQVDLERNIALEGNRDKDKTSTSIGFRQNCDS